MIKSRPETTEEMEKALRVDYTTLLVNYLPSQNDIIWITALSSSAFLVFMLWTGRLTLWSFVGLIFIISSVWHWTRMYKKALSDKHAILSKSENIPAECSPDSMGWSHFVFDLFSKQGKMENYVWFIQLEIINYPHPLGCPSWEHT